jgi:hypothetical protein
MITNPLIETNVIQKLGRLSKILLLAGITAVLATPQVEARPDRDRHRDSDRGSHSRHHGPGRGHEERHYRPHYRPAPVQVRRGWSHPGFYGNYPPVGFVDYRYIRTLPRGYRTVYRGGHRYYYANGSYYWPARYHNSGIFISVRF